MRRYSAAIDLMRRWAWEDHGSSAVALAAVVAFWVGAWWALVLALVILVLIIADSQRRMSRWAGRFITPRLILVAGLIPLAALAGSATAMICAVAVGFATVAERLARNPLLNLGHRRFANIVGVEPTSEAATPSNVAFLTNVSAIGLLWAGIAYASAFAVVAAAAASVGATIVLVVAVARLRRARDRAIAQGFARAAETEPKFLVHWDGPATGAYQVTMWLPYLERLDLPFLVVTRNLNTVEEIAGATSAPVVHCGGEPDIEHVVSPSLRTVFYVNTALKNAHLIRYNALTHIQLNHGDSDKPASVSKAFRAFDANFVAGQAAVDRFEKFGVHIERGQAVVVGRPQVENIAQPRESPDRLTVLYAPTWGGYFTDSDFSSLPLAEKMIGEILERDCRVVFRPHPLTALHPRHAAQAEGVERMLSQHAERTGIQHVWGERATVGLSLVECMNESDAMVADISSTVTDYLFSAKPLAIFAVGSDASAFTRQFPIAEFGYVLTADDESRNRALDDMLTTDSMRALRLKGRSYYLGDFPVDTYASAFLGAARRAVLGDQARAAGHPPRA